MYSFVPAGSYPQSITNCDVFIKYEKNNILKLDITQDDIGRVWLHAPDRTICLVRSKFSTRIPKQLPFPEDFSYDVHLDTNIYKAGGLGEKYLDFVLISAHNGMQQNIHHKDVFKDKDCKLKIIGDSGGAQLKVGVDTFIDPYHVIDWHNNVADIGACLDVAPRPCDRENQAIIDACALASLKNNQIFLKENRGCKLLNVLHGFTLAQNRRWCEMLHDSDKYLGWAAGPDNAESDLAPLRAIMLPMFEFNMKSGWSYKKGEIIPGHYHLFGAGGTTMIPVYAWLGKYVEQLTTDSTSHLSSVRYHSIDCTLLNGKVDRTQIGHKSEITNDLLSPFPANHEVALHLGYWGWFQVAKPEIQISVVTALLGWHNMINNTQYARSWDLFARSTDDLNKYIAVIKQTLGHTGQKAMLACKYVQFVIDHGLDAAEREFQLHLGNDSLMGGRMQTLFAPKNEAFIKKAANLVYAQRDSALHDVLPRYLNRQELGNLGLKWEAADKKSKYESPIVTNNGMGDLQRVAMAPVQETEIKTPDELLQGVTND